MKTYLPILLAAVLFSCTETKSNSQQHSTDSSSNLVDSSSSNIATAVATPIDTFKIGNKLFLVYDLGADSPFEEESESADKPEAKDEHVTREGNTLTIVTENGKTTLKNNLTDTYADYIKFTYRGYYPEIKQFGVSCSLYESGSFLLVNQVTGQNVRTLSAPIISPDKKHVICKSLDLEAGFEVNGIELYTYENDKLTKVGRTVFNKYEWGPGQMKWADNNTLIAEYKTLKGTKPVKIVMQ